MTRWVGWIVAWLNVVCLLWSLGMHAGVHHGWDPSVGPWSHASFTSIIHFFRSSIHLIPSSSPTYIRPRAGPFTSSAPPWARVRRDDGGPPWLDLRGPPGASGRAWVTGTAAGHAGSTNERQRTFPRGNSRPERAQPQRQSFATAFSYSTPITGAPACPNKIDTPLGGIATH
jgi:hypothetical protein